MNPTITHYFHAPGMRTAIDAVHPVTGHGVWSGESPDEIAKRYPGAVALPEADVDRLCAAAARAHYRAGVPVPIDAKRFGDALNVLPPCKWRGWGSHVETFHVSERLIGDLVDWYIRIGDCCWTIVEESRADVSGLVNACRPPVAHAP